jgi:hypothetical protein
MEFAGAGGAEHLKLRSEPCGNFAFSCVWANRRLKVKPTSGALEEKFFHAKNLASKRLIVGMDPVLRFGDRGVKE